MDPDAEIRLASGAGFGKTIFVGDAFIQFGIPAIVAALAHETVARVGVGPGSGWTLDDFRPEVEGYKSSKREQQTDSVERVIRAMGIDLERNRVAITLEGNLLAGSGIGASAAGCVALARALNEALRLGFAEETINEVALEGEKAYHGDPSGVDNTASTFGGILWFRRDPVDRRSRFERISAGSSLDIVLANSGVNVDTAGVVAYKKKQITEHPEMYKAALKESEEQAFALRRALERGDKEEVGRLMNAHHQILERLHFSHERIESILKTAHAEGALGAKVTGGGMGGYALVLTADKAHRERVSRAIEEKGFRILTTEILP